MKNTINLLFNKEKNLIKTFLLFIKLRLCDTIAYLLIPLSEIILWACRKNNSDDFFRIWLICTSKYQFDIGSTLIREIHKIDIKSQHNFENQYDITYIEISKKENKRFFTVKPGKLKELNKNFLLLKTKNANQVFLSSVSPMLFQSNLLYSIFLLLKLKRKINFIDDGLSGSLSFNRHYMNNYCPENEMIYSWNFKNFFKNKEDKYNKKLSFKKLYKIIRDESSYENNISFNKKRILIISSKYFDYKLIKRKLKSENKFNNDLIYIPHPRKWKNNLYFEKYCEIIKPICIESWLIKNKDYIKDIYVGVSATTLIISELFLRNKIKANISLCLQSDLNSNYCKEELSCFIKIAVNSKSFKKIYLNGNLIY